MKRWVCGSALAGVAVCGLSGPVVADITVVVDHQWTVGNNFFSAFAFDRASEPTEFRSGGYGSGVDFRWSRVLDDTVQPWQMEGGVLINNFQWEIFVRDGFAANSGSVSLWGMNFCPLDESYFLNGIGILRGYYTGSTRLDAERDLIKHYPGLPNSPTMEPTNCSVSNVGGIYKLVDSNLTGANGFLASGVEPGHRVTVFPVNIYAHVLPQTFTITNVVSNNELRLNNNPCWYSNETANGIGYLLSIQPHLTLATFRQNIPYFEANTKVGPKAHYKGGMSLDGRTLYLGELITGNLIAVDTQIPETFSVLVSNAELQDYIWAQIDAGRHKAIVNPYQVYADAIDSSWSNHSVDTSVVTASTDEVAVGAASMKVTFNAAGAALVLEADDGAAPDPAGFASIDFWIHGGTDGGQQMDLWLINSNGVGSEVTLTLPLAGAWTHVVIPSSAFAVADDVYTIKFEDTAASVQQPFYLDHLVFNWTDPLPEWAGAFDPAEASVGGSQTHVDRWGRIWFSEGETDDIVWTTDGDTLHTFLRSDEISAAYIANGALDPSDYSVSNGVQVMGLIVDDMGNVYWGENQTRSIWKTSELDPARNIINLATYEELQAALNLNPRGMHCFSIRGKELLTFNFVDGNFIYKVDLDTFDYGDLDGDFDADLADYAEFQRCHLQDASTNGCDRCDLDRNVVVDSDDYVRFASFLRGPKLDPLAFGDFDGDRDADLSDFAEFQQCFMVDPTDTGAGNCVRCDFDKDADIDVDDFLGFEAVLLGPRVW